MRKLAVLLISLILTVGLLGSAHAIGGMSKLTIKVVDETDKPVEGANVLLCFKGGCLKKDATKGKTDVNGLFIASGYSVDGVTGGEVEKSGYYYSGYHHDFIRNTLGVWQPWNKELKVVLRPKIKPVPMYVRDKWVTIPVVGKKVGFDLTKFDWVAPHGLGTITDFYISLTRRLNTHDDFESTVTMTFPNSYDGIQSFELDRGGDFEVGSAFRTPRYAPEADYKSTFSTTLSSRDLPLYRTSDKYYFIRVRSEVDENGKLKRAMYGKMKGRLVAEPRGSDTAVIQFNYWLNPDYTRNMEFDVDRNLFNPLPRGEFNKRIP